MNLIKIFILFSVIGTAFGQDSSAIYCADQSPGSLNQVTHYNLAKGCFTHYIECKLQNNTIAGKIDCFENWFNGFFIEGLKSNLEFIWGLGKEGIRAGFSASTPGRILLHLCGIKSTQQIAFETACRAKEIGVDLFHYIQDHQTEIKNFILKVSTNRNFKLNLMKIVMENLAANAWILAEDFNEISCDKMNEKICTIVGQINFEAGMFLVSALATLPVGGVGGVAYAAKLIASIGAKSPKIAKFLEGFLYTLTKGIPKASLVEATTIDSEVVDVAAKTLRELRRRETSFGIEITEVHPDDFDKIKNLSPEDTFPAGIRTVKRTIPKPKVKVTYKASDPKQSIRKYNQQNIQKALETEKVKFVGASNSYGRKMAVEILASKPKPGNFNDSFYSALKARREVAEADIKAKVDFANQTRTPPNVKEEQAFIDSISTEVLSGDRIYDNNLGTRIAGKDVDPPKGLSAEELEKYQLNSRTYVGGGPKYMDLKKLVQERFFNNMYPGPNQKLSIYGKTQSGKEIEVMRISTPANAPGEIYLLRQAKNVDVPEIMKEIGAHWGDALTSTTKEKKIEAIAKFEWWFFAANPSGRAGAALGDTLSMELQVASKLPIREGFHHMDWEALSRSMEDYVEWRKLAYQ